MYARCLWCNVPTCPCYFCSCSLGRSARGNWRGDLHLVGHHHATGELSWQSTALGLFGFQLPLCPSLPKSLLSPDLHFCVLFPYPAVVLPINWLKHWGYWLALGKYPFESRLERRLSWLRDFMFFLSPSWYYKLGHNRSLSPSVPLIIRHLFTRRYILYVYSILYTIRI
jgi:hypothetical protein